MEKLRDEALLALMERDAAAGLQAAMARYTGPVLAAARTALGAAGTAEDAEECAADAFAALHEHRRRIDFAKGSLAAWLCVVAKRRAIDLLRKRAARGGAALPLEQAALAGAPSAEEEALAAARQQALAAAIAALPPPDGEILLRKYYFGQPSADIGRRVGLSAGAVDTRAHRAAARLRRRMEGENDG